MKVFVKSYGCQMNVYDSDRMVDILSQEGYGKTESVEEANLVILNTCHIREKASEKVYSDLGRILEHRKKQFDQGKRVYIAVTGCVAQAEGREIIKRTPYVDIVLGPQTYHHLPEMLKKANQMPLENPKRGANLVYTEFPIESKFDFLPELNTPQGIAAFLSVQEGCDKMCTFCVVPYTRGAEFSRSIPEILKEAEKLISLGTKEITLLGQNVTAFHGKDETGKEWSLAKLIRHLSLYQEIDRIRYVTSHPTDMMDDIIEAHRDIKQLMPYLHLPFQAGSNKILKAMNRKYTKETYLELVEKFRSARPDMAFATDIIVGFPGETDLDFEETIDVVKKVGFGGGAYSFKYSSRPGTPAALFENQVPEDIKDERLQILQSLLKEQQNQFNDETIGKSLPILFEKPGKHMGQIVGRSPYLQPVHVIAPKELIGQTHQVKVISREGFSLMGVLL